MPPMPQPIHVTPLEPSGVVTGRISRLFVGSEGASLQLGGASYLLVADRPTFAAQYATVLAAAVKGLTVEVRWLLQDGTGRFISSVAVLTP